MLHLMSHSKDSISIRLNQLPKRLEQSIISASHGWKSFAYQRGRWSSSTSITSWTRHYRSNLTQCETRTTLKQQSSMLSLNISSKSSPMSTSQTFSKASRSLWSHLLTISRFSCRGICRSGRFKWLTLTRSNHLQKTSWLSPVSIITRSAST